jgi:4-oxalomesaconate tautomerase
VLGAVSVATACLLEGTPAGEVAEVNSPLVRMEHPSGMFEARVELEGGEVRRAGIVRTARKLMDGTVYPRSY